MYIDLVDIKAGKKFFFNCKKYEILDEKASNPFVIKVYNLTELKVEYLPRYTKIPCDAEFWRELHK